VRLLFESGEGLAPEAGAAKLEDAEVVAAVLLGGVFMWPSFQ
jgi:hypothetical protein